MLFKFCFSNRKSQYSKWVKRAVRGLNWKEFITQTIKTALRTPINHVCWITLSGLSTCCLDCQKYLPPCPVCLESSYSSFKTHLKHHLHQTALMTPFLCYCETSYIHVLLLYCCTFHPIIHLLIGLPLRLWSFQRWRKGGTAKSHSPLYLLYLAGCLAQKYILSKYLLNEWTHI